MKASRYIIFRKHRESDAAAGRPLSVLKLIGLTALVLAMTAFVAAGIRYALFTQDLPSLKRFQSYYEAHPEPTRFYARNGETLLFTLAYENFEHRDLAICDEDGEGCFPHTFLESARITREINIRQGNAVPTAEEMVRKVYAEEIEASRDPELLVRILSRQVRSIFGEEQLLTWYYNNAWFGQMAFGLDAAARLYLDKAGSDLTDAECVLMSAIINAPMLNPIDSRGALRDSYLSQLSQLQQAALFTDDEAELLSRNNFIIFEPPQYIGGSEPDIITRKALDTILNRYGREQVERGGLKVITSEDIILQGYLNCVTADMPREDKADLCPLSAEFTEDELEIAGDALRTAPASIAVLDVESGELLAALEAQATQDHQRTYENYQEAYPLGSTMNIFAALTAFSAGDSPSTLLWDLESSYGTEAANDSDESYAGPLRLREALAEDHLRPLTARLGTYGSGAVQRFASLFGLTGSSSVPENEVLYKGSNNTAEAAAFSLIPFATLGDQTGSDAGGTMHPVTILRIETEENGNEFPQPFIRKSLIASNLAYLVHHVFSRNTERIQLSDRPAAVKTGSVRGEDSLWVSGYSTQISCALRLGDPQNYSAFVEDTDRIRITAGILWQSIMEKAHQGIPATGWETPQGISQVRVCLPSGKLPTAACQETMTEVFLSGNEPYEYDEYYAEVRINRSNRMLATRFTAPEDIETAVFLDLPSEASAWAEANGIESMPAEYDPIRDENRQSGAVRIESPTEFQSFSRETGKQIDVIVRLSLTQKPLSLQVSLGSGMYPDEWEEVCTGSSLENGRWMICSLDPSTLDPGLYVLRTAFTLPDQGYRSAETYFEVE